MLNDLAKENSKVFVCGGVQYRISTTKDTLTEVAAGDNERQHDHPQTSGLTDILFTFNGQHDKTDLLFYIFYVTDADNYMWSEAKLLSEMPVLVKFSACI